MRIVGQGGHEREHKKSQSEYIIANYNYAQALEQRLDSIIQQTYRDFEIIFLMMPLLMKVLSYVKINISTILLTSR